MTPTQAAAILEMSPQYVRDLIRAGKIHAKPQQNKYPNHDGSVGFTYSISEHEVEKAKKLPRRAKKGAP